jgi:single-strand DNA-binding protein
MDNTVMLVGNLASDPELRFTPGGKPVANFSLAVNRRYKDGDEWKDKLDGFFRCNVWGDMAENVSESLSKGARVMVTGKLQQRSWEDKDSGEKRYAIEVQVDDVGPSLKWATAQIERTQRRSNGGSSGGGGGGSSWADEEGGF